MKSLESALESIKEGSILSISKSLETEGCDATLIRFDGDIMKEVNAVDIGNFLNMFHNILRELDKKYVFQIKYDYKNKTYQNSFFKIINHGKYKPSTLELINELVTSNLDMFNGIIELDAKIANLRRERPVVKHKKIS